MWRVAVLHHGSPSSGALVRLRQGLHRGGLIEGVHCIVDAAGAEGVWARLPQLVEQLLSRAPNVIVAIGAIAALAAQRATARVPILHAIVLDPADIGLTARNVAGVTTFDPDQATRHLRLLGQLVPGLRSVAVVADADAPRGPDGCNPLLSRCLRAATALGLQTTCITLSGRRGELEDGLDRALRAHAQALVALEVPAVLARLGDIVRLAETHRLPTLSPYGGHDTGVMMQGATLHDAIDAVVAHVTALFHGAGVAELPQGTVRHERLVIHQGRARRIGLGIPTCLLDRATLCIDDEPKEQAIARL
jgi:putative ABC transport system substrate-binding protein